MVNNYDGFFGFWNYLFFIIIYVFVSAQFFFLFSNHFCWLFFGLQEIRINKDFQTGLQIVTHSSRVHIIMLLSHKSMKLPTSAAFSSPLWKKRSSYNQCNCMITVELETICLPAIWKSYDIYAHFNDIVYVWSYQFFL